MASIMRKAKLFVKYLLLLITQEAEYLLKEF